MQTSWFRRLLIVPPILIGVALLIFFARNKPEPVQNEEAEQSRTVRIIVAEPTRVIPRVVGYGTVEPARVWNAVAQVSGQIEAVHPDFKKGAILPEGTEIVRIAPEDYQIAIQQAEANIRAADAKLQELSISEQNTRASQELERQSLAINEKELQRKETLASRGTVATSTLDQERNTLLNQRKRVQELENALRLLPTQIKAQEEQKAVYKAQLETARLSLARTIIKLPFRARISAVNVEVTQFVAAGTQLGSADSTKEAEVTAQIPLSHLRGLIRASTNDTASQPMTPGEGAVKKLADKLQLSAIVRLSLGDQSVEWPGRVVRISDTIDTKTRTVGTIVAVDDAYKGLVPGERPPLVKGMFTEVELRTKPLDGQIIVPRSALHNDTVYLIDKDDRLVFRKVEVRLLQGDFAIVKGVNDGERIVISDVSPVIEGMLLKPIVDKETTAKLVRQAGDEGSVR